MSVMISQITSLEIVYSTVYLGADQRKHQSSASLAFSRGIHRWPANSPHKGRVTRKMFPLDDVIMLSNILGKRDSRFRTRHSGSNINSILANSIIVKAWTLHHDDVIKWKHFPRYWPLVRGIHRSRWIPRTKASDAGLWCFLSSASE